MVDRAGAGQRERGEKLSLRLHDRAIIARSVEHGKSEQPLHKKKQTVTVHSNMPPTLPTTQSLKGRANLGDTYNYNLRYTLCYGRCARVIASALNNRSHCVHPISLPSAAC